MQQVLQNASILLKNVAGITKWVITMTIRENSLTCLKYLLPKILVPLFLLEFFSENTFFSRLDAPLPKSEASQNFFTTGISDNLIEIFPIL